MLQSESFELTQSGDNLIFHDKTIETTVLEPSDMRIAILDADLISRKKHRFP